MKFRLELNLKPNATSISHNDGIVSIGSCFSENIGRKLYQSGFKLSVNHFGVIFNPISISDILIKAINKEFYSFEDITEYDNIFYSLKHHGKFNAISKEYLLDEINSIQGELIEQLNSSNKLLITFGSAWVYEHVEEQIIVANCHKLPNKKFVKRLLSIEEIVSEYSKVIDKLPSSTHIIFTVSPVRHWKDGAIENTRSKSILHLAISELEQKYEAVSYFPSYEIVMDELRDYRFFNQDMLHPTNQAIDYIYGKFQDVYFSEETKNIIDRVEKFNLLNAHKSIKLNSASDIKLKEKIDTELEHIQQILPDFKS